MTSVLDCSNLTQQNVYALLSKENALTESLQMLKDICGNNPESSSEILLGLKAAIRHYYSQQKLLTTVQIQEVTLEISELTQDPGIPEILAGLFRCLGEMRSQPSLLRVMELSKSYLSQYKSITFNILLLQALINASTVLYGIQYDIQPYYIQYKNLLEKVFLETISEQDFDFSEYYRLISLGMTFLYFEDSPRDNRRLRNRMGYLGSQVMRNEFEQEIKRYEKNIDERLSNVSSAQTEDPLKIGYITDCLRVHSVGWLVRWVLQYHDPNLVDVYTYSTYNPKDFIHDQLIEQYGSKIKHIDYPIQHITDQIQLDKIDILVDLGSLTEYQNCVVTAVKPAPVQLTWLGMDASGIPTVDYYLADRFSLPDDAQDYYSEKLIKMPHCYIAVDGFELDRPSTCRADFGIPEDAVIYLSSQGGAKRHPDNMKLQVQILAQVPKSYLLIKGMKTDESVILKNFAELAVSLGVDSDRIKIMPATPKEDTHRANLKIADIILDTYPYNGATTTLEALWCEVPLVTRVGQQFAARNSYSMLMNAGLTEGIAWTDDDYVNWGVMFGLNRDLRDRVRWKLRQGKRTSPLWDARQFTRDLEAVYQQIWDGYLKDRNFAQSLA